MTILVILFQAMLLFLALFFTNVMVGRLWKNLDIEAHTFAFPAFFWAAFWAALQVPA